VLKFKQTQKPASALGNRRSFWSLNLLMIDVAINFIFGTFRIQKFDLNPCYMILRSLSAFFLTVTICFSAVAVIPSFPKVDHVQQDRTQIAFDNMMSELARVHQAVFALPYEYDYIKNTLMAEVVTKRAELAPHWPDRASFGDDTALGQQLFKEWFLTYPGESTAYIAFVDQFVKQHAN
jgi:hypothetical protein